MKPGTLEEISAPNKWKLMILVTTSISLLMLSVTPIFVDPIMAYARFAFRIEKESLVYKLLMEEFPGALVETYIFNITNADKFLAGEDQKLKVEEVGPFTYQEYRNHDDFYLDEEANTMHYTPVINPRFHRQYSVADPKDVNVTIPNIPMLTMGSTMGNYPAWTQMGFNLLVNRMDAKPVTNLRAYDFLWGYREPLIALGNTLMPGWINFENLGMMDRLYDKKVKDRLVVGTSDTDKFQIKTVNGEGGIGNRGYDPSVRSHCNTFTDTYEGLAYPPGLTPETKLRLYRNVFCRILDLQYVGSKVMEFGPEAFVYRLSNTTFKRTSENDCLCGKSCIDGMTDLSPCFYGFGVSFSQAHFFDVNPEIYERIEGMHPDREKHGSEFVVDPNLGSVISTRITLQLNVVVENADFNIKTKPFSRMIIPVLYFKIIQPELSDKDKATYRSLYLVLPYVLLAIQVLLFVAAVILLAYAMRFLRLAWLCKKALGFEVHNSETIVHLHEEPLLENNTKLTTELILNKQILEQKE